MRGKGSPKSIAVLISVVCAVVFCVALCRAAHCVDSRTAGQVLRQQHPKSTELVDKRTACSKTFRNPDGTCTWSASQAKVHYRAANGKWQEVDLAIKPVSAGPFSYAMTRNDYQSFFAADASRPVLAKFQTGGWSVSFGAHGARSGRVAAKGNTITFKNAFPGADLRYVTNDDELREEIILHRVPRTNTWRFRLDLQGVRLEHGKSGTLDFVDVKSGRRLWWMPEPYMVDAKGVRSQAVSKKVEVIDGRTWLTVTADKDWLRNPARAYPVIVDPTWTASTPTADSYVRSGASGTNYGSSTTLNVGCDGATADGQRIYVKWTMDGRPPAHSVLQADGSARMKFYATSHAGNNATTVSLLCRNVLADWTEGGITWANKPGDGANTFWSVWPPLGLSQYHTYSYNGHPAMTGKGLPDSWGVYVARSGGSSSTEFKQYFSKEQGSSFAPVLEADYITSVYNGNFDEETTAWSVAKGWASYQSSVTPGWAKSTSTVRSSPNSQRIQPPNVSGGNAGVRQTIAAGMGEAVTIVGYVYPGSASTYISAGLGVRWDGSTTLPGSFTYAPTHSAWNEVVAAGNCTTTSGVTVFLHTTRNASGTYYGYFDDFVSYHAYVPPAPTVGGATSNSLNVDVDPGANSSNSSAQYAITIGGGAYTLGTHWVQADGSVGTTMVWQTDATWGNKTVTGLAINTTYQFQVRARYSATYTQASYSGATAQGTTQACPVNPPTGGTATANSTSQITWGWTRASGASGEVYRAYNASTGGTLIWTSASQATSYAETGLSTNTLYGTGAAAGNLRHLATFQDCESPTRLALPGRYTLQANATTPTFGTTTTSSIVLNTTGPVNLTAGSSGVIFKRGTTDLTKVQALTTTDSGLTANTQYTYTARGVNGDNVASTESGSASRFTLAKPPTYGTSGDVTIQCAQGQSKTDCTEGQNITFTFNNSFGSGAANVGQFGFLWDQNPGDPASWTGEQFWTSGSTLVRQAGTAGQSFYLHIRSYNNDSPKVVNTTVLNLGPYTVPLPTPNPPSKAAATNIGTNTITWNWNDLSNNEDGFKVYNAASGGTLLQTLGQNVQTWQEPDLENNTSYSRWVSAYNVYGDSTRTALDPASTLIPDCIQNGGFEGTFYSGRGANWKAFNSPTLASSTDRYSGAYSQRSEVNAASPRKGVYQIFNVTQGRWYNASFWVKNNDTTTASRISLDPDPSTLEETLGKETNTATWGERDVQSAVADGVQATGTTMAVIVSAFKYSGSVTGYGYFDEVRISPGITHPSNSTACAGSTTTFSVTATGTGNTFKWQKNTGSGWADITTGDGSGFDTATYTTPTLTDAMNGYQYRCVVTGPSGDCGATIASKAATLTVTPLTAVTSPPGNATACAGSTATFTVAAVGGGLGYQWQKNTGSGWANIPSGEGSGQNAVTYTTPSTTTGMNGWQYRCVVSGTCGPSATSNAATLTVSTGPPAPSASDPSDIATSSIKWNWQTVTGATSYKLWTASSGGTQIGGTITTNYYTESGLEPDISYTRYVEAIDVCGTSATRTQLGPVSTNRRPCAENGGFEGGFSGSSPNVIGTHWSKGSGGDTTQSFSQESTYKRSGSYSQRITDPSGGAAYTAWILQRVNVQPNRQYLLSYWSYRPSANGFVTGINYHANGGDLTGSGWETGGSASGGTWTQREVGPFTSGTAGRVTIGFRGGFNGGDTWGCVDDIALVPAPPTSSGGGGAVCSGGSATLTASGGFGGSSSEMNWYTGPGGTGTHVGTGTSLELTNITQAGTYYPRWEDSSHSGACRVSADGPAVSITIITPPNAPADDSPTAESTSSITWKWSDVSGESGYRVKDTGGNNKSGDLAANTVEWQETTGISANTQYTRKIYAFNACGESTGSSGQSKYSLQNAASTPTFSNITTTGFRVSTTGPVNLTSGSSGVIFHDGTSDRTKVTELYDDVTGLTANTQYTFKAKAVNGDGVETGYSSTASVWTLSVPPGADTITPSSTTPCSGATVTWTADGFGAGKVQYYRYVWNQNPSHTWDDTEDQWSSGTIATEVTGTGTWYLHVKGYNGADVGNGTYDYSITAGYGPDAPEDDSPTADDTTRITWKWEMVSGVDGYRIKDTSGMLKGSVTGDTTVEWQESDLNPNTQYTRKIYAYSGPCESAASIGQTKHTLAVAPTVGVNVATTADSATWYNASSWPGLTNPQGFGTGEKVSKFRYKWSTNANDAIAEGEGSEWSVSPLTATPTSDGSAWYIYLRSYNGDDKGNGSLKMGPYKFDFTSPIAAPAYSTSFSSNGVKINIGSGSDTLSGLHAAGAYKATRDGFDSGWTASSTIFDPATSVNAGETVTYIVKTRDAAANESSETITARKPIDSANKWIYSTGGTTLAPPGVWPLGSSKVFTGSGDYKVHGMASSDGSMLWTPVGANGQIQGRTPVADFGSGPYVFAGSQDTYVYKISAADGSTAWSVSLGSGNAVQGKVSGQLGVNIGGTTYDLIFAGTYNNTTTDNFLRALNAVNGATVWTFGSGYSVDKIAGDPCVDASRNRVYFTSLSNGGTSQPSVWAVNTTNGQLVWSKNPGDVTGSCEINTDGSRLYVGTSSGTLYAYGTTDGTQIWSRVLDSGYAIYGAPYFYNGRLYVATNAGKIWCVNATNGTIVTTWGTSGYVSIPNPSQPLIVGSYNRIYVGSSDGRLYQLNISNGATSAYKSIGYTVGDCAIDVSTSYIYCGASDGRIYAFAIPF